MFYKLNDNYILRGWNELPYTLCDTQSSHIEFLDRIGYQAALFCNGLIHIDSILVSPEHKKLIRKFEEKGIVKCCEYGDQITEYQKYQLYPNRFIHFAQWSITGKCNYKCRHCMLSSPQGHMNEFSMDECFKIIESLAQCGVSSVTLTGGEPLFRDDFIQIIDKLIEKKIRIDNIYTNGKLLTNELLDDLEKRNIKPLFTISFDGAGWHDWLRGIENAEKYALAAFSLCQDRGFSTSAVMSLHKLNKHSIRDTVNLLAELGVQHLKICRIISVGEWLTQNDDVKLSVEEAYQTYLDYIPKYYDDGKRLNLTIEGFFATKKDSDEYSIPNVKYDDSFDPCKVSVCEHAKNVLYISADGDVLPCMPLSGCSINKLFPNILTDSLCDILTGSHYLTMIDVSVKHYLEKNPECFQCDYKMACGGGCRGRAIEPNNIDYHAIDRESCVFFRGGYIDKIRNCVGNCGTYKNS